MSTQKFDTFSDVRAWLDRRGLFHMDFGLDRMKEMISALDLKRPSFKIIQVLGTNGKGSTSAFLASLFKSHGARAGLYTSPHFVSTTERVSVCGKPVPENLWVSCANEIMAQNKSGDLTYFEFLTILALLIFRSEKVDVAILEAGLGGAGDATTAVPADMECYAPIAMDHAAIIGPTIADIARDKAAAIQSSAPVFSVPQFPAAMNELRRAASLANAPLALVEALPEDYALGLEGKHQHLNSALALAAFVALAPDLCIKPDTIAIKAGLKGAFLPGRLQRIAANGAMPALILDGAHNPHGMAALIAQENLAPGAIIFSCLDDKDWHTTLSMLIRRFPATPFLIYQLKNDRAASAGEVAAFCCAHGGSARLIANGNMDAAILSARAESLLLTGSLYLLAEFFSLHPDYLMDPH